MPCQEPPKICPVCKEEANFKFIQDYQNKWGRWSLYECSKCKVQFWMPFEEVCEKKYEEDVDYTSKLNILNRENCWLMVKDYWNMNQFITHLPFKDPKGKKLLDLGCGTGEFLVVMQNLGYEVEGVDFNKKAVNIARYHLGIDNVYQEDVINFLKDKQEEYDVITAFEIIEHIDQPKKLLELTFQALKPGGYFAVSIPNRERYFEKITPEIEPWDFPYQHLTRWNLEALKRFIESHSFDIILTKKEIPVGWVMARLRFTLESLFKKRKSFGPVEKVRDCFGFKKYKFVKSLIKSAVYPLAFFLFYFFNFQGGELYILAKKKQHALSKTTKNVSSL